MDDNPAFQLSDRKLKTLRHYLNNKYNCGKRSINDLLQMENTVIDTRQSDIRFYHNLSPTLRTGRHGLLYVKNGTLRELSGFEALLLQGIPLKLARKTAGINNKDLLAQAGNAMSVNVIHAVGQQFMNFILQNPHEPRPRPARFANRKTRFSK